MTAISAVYDKHPDARQEGKRCSLKSIEWLSGILSMALLTAFPAGARELTSSGYIPVDAAELPRRG